MFEDKSAEIMKQEAEAREAEIREAQEAVMEKIVADAKKTAKESDGSVADDLISADDLNLFKSK
ncbi:MAG: hypothetical protein DI585_03450 [Pseudomonas fluorescens]|nr:MAG: hypothetical protein DI585_03450 [Pseudomonas fluorescens]